jgi:hypothetical protein
MNRSLKLGLSGSIAALLFAVSGQALSADETPVPAKWQVQEVRFSYAGFTTAYDCDAVAAKIKSILVALGAHESTQVRATGCPTNWPSRTFFVTITAATPVPVAELEKRDAEKSSAEKSREELLKRLGVKNRFEEEEFLASWKTVDLEKERRLRIEPGDCELMEDLRDEVFPKLGIKIEEERISCTPNQLSLQPPHIRVSALTALKSADEQ